MFYGWVIVGIAFVTMALSVTARTSFSLLLPPMLDEFAWDRAEVAGAFSFGFFCSALISPWAGKWVDRQGPRPVITLGAVMMCAGLFLSTRIEHLWELYLTLGLLVGAGANLMSYTAQSQYLPNWFVRKRGLAISIAFSGVGIGSILILPLLQQVILTEGWRQACLWMAAMLMLIALPLNRFVRRKPEDMGLLPDGDTQSAEGLTGKVPLNSHFIVDTAWASKDWTGGAALQTSRFWWICGGFFCALVAWYAVQVHQTKYLLELGFDPSVAAWALGWVSVVAIPGQILLGAASDRIGREAVWSIGCLGFAICYFALLMLEHSPWTGWVVFMVFSQGFLGYSLTSVMGAIVAELFQGKHFAAIFGLINIALLGGGAFGPWLAGWIHDQQGSYRSAFMICIAACLFSSYAIFRASPGKVRRVRKA